MKRSIHRFACAALVLSALTITGCRLDQLVVLVPDFATNGIQGLQLWRADDETGEIYTEAGRIVFGELTPGNGTELLAYTVVSSQGVPLEAAFPAFLIRGEDGDASATVYFLRFFLDQARSEPPGWIRVSSFNAVGDSELSVESTFL